MFFMEESKTAISVKPKGAGLIRPFRSQQAAEI